jgi:pyruvate ferredoxin oxidoreductase delta subunit
VVKSKPGYKDIPAAGVTYKPATDYHTGDWRNKRPVRDAEKCTRCLTCWVFCPDAAISWDGEDIHFNLDFCKGCGICAHECPVNCIEMKPE